MMTTPLLRLLGRGAVSGAAAGLLSAGVSFAYGELFLHRAMVLVEAAGPEPAAVLSRGQQLGGLALACLAGGVALGVLFAVVHALVDRRHPDADPWRRSVRLALAGFVGAGLIPFLRFPADPPGVVDPVALDARTSGYLLAVAIGLAAVAGAALLHRGLARLQVTRPMRQLAAAAVVLIGVESTWLVGPAPVGAHVPADLLWDFRIASLVTIATLWLGLGVVFGLLGDAHRDQAALAVRHRAVF